MVVFLVKQLTEKRYSLIPHQQLNLCQIWLQADPLNCPKLWFRITNPSIFIRIHIKLCVWFLTHPNNTITNSHISVCPLWGLGVFTLRSSLICWSRLLLFHRGQSVCTVRSSLICWWLLLMFNRKQSVCMVRSSLICWPWLLMFHRGRSVCTVRSSLICWRLRLMFSYAMQTNKEAWLRTTWEVTPSPKHTITGPSTRVILKFKVTSCSSHNYDCPVGIHINDLK